ncbi:hypothetical protein [Mangrovibacterium lignilyticum]|uniref:hypothetical protein n=1 Tax=Mangrovibacterium lignilyticum TaxID=2668052 RepID=UPI0013CF70CB|nr:hypothetical protein [Mangrovibacterium lignilyticum]
MPTKSKHIATVLALLIFMAGAVLGGSLTANPIVYKFQIIKGGKACYTNGDSLLIAVTAKQKGNSCLDGVEKTRLFYKGFKLVHQQSWADNNCGVWTKIVQLIVTGAENKKACITAFRQTDSGTIAETFTLNTDSK